MGKDDLGPIAQYNSLTDPYLQGYYSKSIIRHHLKQTGLISRKGDIIPEEVWRKRIATKEKMQQASRLIASKIVQQAIELQNLERAEIRRKLDEVAKKELVRRIRGQSVQNRELPLLWPNNRGQSEERIRVRSRSRSPSEHIALVDDSDGYYPDRHRQYRRTGQKLGHKRLNSRKRLTKLNRGLTVLPKQEAPPVMVTMYYYGKSVNIPFDTQVFEYRDEIAIYQQHCGGENLIVYSGLHQAGDKFEFRSKRHKEYPFSLTIYINGTYDCRISTCCEYKHQLNVKIGGKGGRFAITNVTGSQPCLKCLLDKSEQEAKRKREKDEKRRKAENNYDDIEVQPLPPIVTRKSPSSQEATEIEVKHEETKDESYEDEFNDSEEKVIDEEKIESDRVESVKSNRSSKEADIVKVEIPVRHEADESEPSVIESEDKSPRVEERKPTMGSPNARSNRYSSNDVIEKIENEAETFRSTSTYSKKSARDNTSEDESKLEERPKSKTPSQKDSKQASRANSARSQSAKSDNGSEKQSRVGSARNDTDSDNDSDTDKLLSRIKSSSEKGSKTASPVERAKSKTPSQKASRTVSPARSVTKSPLEKEASKAASPARSSTKSPSQKGSKTASPVERKSSTRTSTPADEKTSRKSSAKSRNSDKDSDLSDSEEQELKVKASKSKTPSPTKGLSRPQSKSPSQKQNDSLLSSTDDDTNNESSLFNSNNNSLNYAKGEIRKLDAVSSDSENINPDLDNTNKPSSSPFKSKNPSPDLKSSHSSRHSVTDEKPASARSGRPASSASKKSENLNEKQEESEPEEEEVYYNRAPSAASKKSNEDKQEERSSSKISKKSVENKPGSTAEQERPESKKSNRPASNAEQERPESKESSRPASNTEQERPESKKSSRPASNAEQERPKSKTSNRPDSQKSNKSQFESKPDIPEVNVIPSSDNEKNSTVSLNDETKWYKDEDLKD